MRNEYTVIPRHAMTPFKTNMSQCGILITLYYFNGIPHLRTKYACISIGQISCASFGSTGAPTRKNVKEDFFAFFPKGNSSLIFICFKRSMKVEYEIHRCQFNTYSAVT